MKKFAIILLSILIAGLFVACNQDITVDAQTYANMEVGTFVLNGQNYATLQAAVDAIGSKAAGDNVIRLTKNASGPGAKIASKDVTIDFQGYTYSFTNVNGLQGQDVTGKDFGLSITTGSDVVLKGLQKIDLNDKTTTDLTMVYVEGAATSLTIEDAPKMEVANSQYVFWAANGATLTIGSTSETATTPTTITGKIAATGTSDSKPVVSFNNDTKIEASELKADSAVVVINTSEASTIDSFIGANEANIVVSGTGDVTVTENNSESAATYTIENTSSTTPGESSTVIVPTTDGTERIIDAGEKVEDDSTEKEESTSVAMIGSTIYETLNAAWVDACVEGATITVLTNLSNEATQELPYGTLGANGFAIDKEVDVVLDLNGYTLTFEYENKTIPLNNRAFTVKKGSLVVNGGSIDTKGAGTTSSNGKGYYGAFRIEENGNLKANDVKLFNARPWGLNVKVLGGEAALNNVTITSSYGGGIEVTEADLGTHSKTGKATLTDCTFTQTGYFDHCSTTLSVSGGSELNIVSGTYTSDNYALYVFSSGGIINVRGGSFTGNKDGIAIIAAIDEKTYPQYEGGLSIIAGKFSGGYSITLPAYMSISGGTYDHDPSAYVAKGYAAKKTGDVWIVSKADEEVEVTKGTTTERMSLAEFRKEWNSGEFEGNDISVKLLKDVDISGTNWYPIGTWEFPYYGTFDGNGFTIKGLYAHSTDSENVGTYANNSTVGFGETFGFFGIVGGANTTVENIVFTDVDINIYDGKNVGSVIGYAPSNSKFKAASRPTGADSMVDIEPYKSSSTFKNKWVNNDEIGTHAVKLSGITVSGTIKGTSAVGGIAGKLYTSGKVEVLSCTNNANITGGSNTSGIVGYIYYSSDITVSGCVNAGNVVLTGGAGIVNFNDLGNKKITNNSNSGNIIYNASYTKTSANSYSWDFIAGGVHNNRVYSEYSGNVNTGKFFIQESTEPESTKGVLIVDTDETITISSVSEYTDVVVNGTLNIDADTNVYGCIWVEASGVLNVNASLTVSGTQGTLNLYNSSMTVSNNGSVKATSIIVPEDFLIINNGTFHINSSGSDYGLNKNNLTFENNGTFIAESNVFYGDNLSFINNGVYKGNLILTGGATITNNENGSFQAHNGNGIDFRGGSGLFTNHATNPFGTQFDGVSIWAAGIYTVVGANAHLGYGVTNLILTQDGDTYTATNE